MIRRVLPLAVLFLFYSLPAWSAEESVSKRRVTYYVSYFTGDQEDKEDKVASYRDDLEAGIVARGTTEEQERKISKKKLLELSKDTLLCVPACDPDSDPAGNAYVRIIPSNEFADNDDPKQDYKFKLNCRRITKKGFVGTVEKALREIRREEKEESPARSAYAITEVKVPEGKVEINDFVFKTDEEGRSVPEKVSSRYIGNSAPDDNNPNIYLVDSCAFVQRSCYEPLLAEPETRRDCDCPDRVPRTTPSSSRKRSPQDSQDSSGITFTP